MCLFKLKAQRRQWHPTPVLLPWKSHGWRSLEGCSPWGRWGSDMTERLPFHFSLSCTGEGNGNPLQRSCLENPRDGGAWWAAVYGIAQSQTRLKWLSSKALLHIYIKKNKKKLTEINYTYVSFNPIYFLIGGLLLYRILSFSVKHQHNLVYFIYFFLYQSLTFISGHNILFRPKDSTKS